MSLRHLVSATALVVLVTALAAPAEAQRRKVEPIKKPVEVVEVPVEDAPPPPTREQCEEAARQIAAAYGPDELEDWLADDFPNRAELLTALRKASLAAQRTELRVESVDAVRVGDWVELPERSGWIVSTCSVQLRTRLLFDGAAGERRVGPVGRAKWRIRFVQPEEP